MWPVIFQLGQWQLHTISILMFLAFFLASFVFWRKGREEHYPLMPLFDGWFWAWMIGFVVARAGYIVLNFSFFSWNLAKWLDVFTYPGVNYFLLFAGAGIYLYRYALDKKWDVFEVLDFAVISLALAQVWMWLGLLFEGINFGVATAWPVGVVFPGLLEKHHPLQLYYVIFYVVLFMYLSRVEYRYRTFAWYRHGKKTAQTGFLTSMFFIWTGLFNVIMTPFKLPELILLGVRVDVLVSLVILLFGVFLLLIRSGRISTKFLGRRNKGLLEKFKV